MMIRSSARQYHIIHVGAEIPALDAIVYMVGHKTDTLIVSEFPLLLDSGGNLAQGLGN